ncbi:hypothetical protein Alches_15320 [Alicyclobacillus hesperidum subsp. aegles]|nr:hypothetical protein Alches_15320 [Alicyclobacillus hesperidum subsp. aegles]
MAAGFINPKVVVLALVPGTARLVDASPILAGLRSKSVEYDLPQFTLFAFGETVWLVHFLVTHVSYLH